MQSCASSSASVFQYLRLVIGFYLIPKSDQFDHPAVQTYAIIFRLAVGYLLPNYADSAVYPFKWCERWKHFFPKIPNRWTHRRHASACGVCCHASMFSLLRLHRHGSQPAHPIEKCPHSRRVFDKCTLRYIVPCQNIPTRTRVNTTPARAPNIKQVEW